MTGRESVTLLCGEFEKGEWNEDKKSNKNNFDSNGYFLGYYIKEG